MDTQDMLSSILNDPEKMKSIMSIASSFLGQNSEGGGAPFAPPAPQENPVDSVSSEAQPTGNFSGNPVFNPPSGIFSGGSAFDPSAELISKAIPLISAIAQSGKNAINHDKMNLLLSLKPFVANDVSGQMDHAVRLLSMARMAKAAMSQIGNIAGSDGKTEL